MPLPYGRWWFGCVACLATGWACAQPADGTREQPPPAPEAESAPSLLDGPWFGPISASGVVSYELRALRGEQQPSTLSHLASASLGIRTYVLQPWLATLGATLQLTAGKARWTHDEPERFGPVDRIDSGERFVTGKVRLDLFPRSRFPFEVHLERRDSRIDTGLQSPIDFYTYNIGFSQQYRPPDGQYRLYGSYNHHAQVSRESHQTQDVLLGEFETRWAQHDLGLSLSASRGRREDDDSTHYQSLVARHRFSPRGELSIDSTANLTRSVDRIYGTKSDLAVLQASSVGMWNPEGENYALNASVRTMVLRDRVAGAGTESVGLTAGGSYTLSPNARLLSSATANLTHTQGGTSQSAGASVGATWQGDSLEFAGFRYEHYASASAGGSANSTAQQSESQTLLQAQAGHSISRSLPLGESANLSLQLSQSLNVSRLNATLRQPGQREGIERILQQAAALTWTAAGTNSSVYARLSVQDSRELHDFGARYRLANFQLSGTYGIGRNASLTGEITLQRSWQAGSGLWDDGLGFTMPGERTRSSGASGEITFRHDRVFGVPRLAFTSRLKLAQDVLRQAGMFLTIPERETRLWENQLSWGIGRLETQLLLRMSEVDGQRHDFLMLRAQRSLWD